MPVLDLTIAIPCKNEEKNLARCLDAIGTDLAKHIVLIDSGSTDRTIEIAKEYGVTVIDFKWDGRFPKKRNWYLRNHTPATKWVMFLDADEYLTPDFKKELQEKIKDESKTGFHLSYTVYFLGKKLKGGYPLRKLALFQVGKGEYEFIEEQSWSNLDMEVHEHPIIEGEIGTIKSKIDHQDFRGVSHYIIKHNEYSHWEAMRFLAQEKAGKQSKGIKYRLMKSVWIGPAYFMGSFFLLGGFRDGVKGLVFAILKSSYFTQVYAKILEQKEAVK